MAFGFGTGGFGSASTDRLKFNTAIGFATTNCWFFRAYQHGSGGGAQGRVWIGINSGLTISNSIQNDDTGPSLLFNCGQWTTVGQWTIPRPSLDAWHSHVVGYSTSALGNVPTWSVDGVAQTVTTLTAPTGSAAALTAFHYVGNRQDVAADRAWDGMICDFFTCNRLPTADEAAQYHAGFSGRFLRRGTSTVQNHDMIRDQGCYSTTNTVTVTGTVVQPHPRVIFPGSRRTAWKKPAVAAGTKTIYHHFQQMGVY